MFCYLYVYNIIMLEVTCKITLEIMSEIALEFTYEKLLWNPKTLARRITLKFT